MYYNMYVIIYSIKVALYIYTLQNVPVIPVYTVYTVLVILVPILLLLVLMYIYNILYIIIYTVVATSPRIQTVMASLASSAGESKGDEPQLLTAGIYAANPSTSRGAASNLDASADGALLIYTQGKNVVVRALAPDANQAFVFQGHKATATVARFSPDGKWVASGDDSGWVHVWAWDDAEHAIKKSIKVMGACVNDLAWGPQNKRIGVVGDGGKRARCILAFSGSDQAPDMSGHIKKVLTLAYKQTSPCKIVTGGEDFQTIIHKGPPFRRVKSNKVVHRGAYINCIRFNPAGDKYCSVASDKKVVIYNTEDGAVLHTLKEHKGGVYGCSWTADGASVFTCSADKTCKLWDAAAGTCTATFNVSASPTVDDMQVACLVAPSTGTLVSVSLSGSINIFDAGKFDAPARVISGHNATITCLALDAAAGQLVTGDASGAVRCWRVGTGNVSTKNTASVAVGGGRFYSTGWDNVVRSGSVEGATFDTETSLGGQPKANGLHCCASDPGLVVVVSSDGVRLLRDGNEVSHVESSALGANPTCCDVSPAGDQVAVGLENNSVVVLPVTGDALGDKADLYKAPGKPTVLRYSPDGAHLAVGDAQREIQVWNFAASKKPIRSGMWKSHASAISTLAWHPDNTHIASGSLDQAIFIWTLADSSAKEKMPLAHLFGRVTAVAWAGETTLLSAGVDSVIKTWKNVTMP